MITSHIVTLETPCEPPADQEHAKDDGHPLLGKTMLAVGVMLAALAIPYATPELRRYRVVAAPWDKAVQEAETAEADPTAPAITDEIGEQAVGAAKNEATVANALPAAAAARREELDPAVTAKLAGSLAIEDPSGHALDAFYAQLGKTIRKESSLHILHYGDSVIASDLIAGPMRRRMQERFGDAGHGFILIANPFKWYFHNDVTFHNDTGWEAMKMNGPYAADGYYGLGGVGFLSYGGGLSFFGTKSDGDYGRKVSRFDIYYLQEPNGGDIDLRIKNGASEKFSTKGEPKASKIHSVKVPDGEAVLTMRALSRVRVFGVSLERDTVGVTYNSLGAHAALAAYWKKQDVQHWKDQMELRKPSLIVLQYGTNESALDRIEWDKYEEDLATVFDMVKTAAPAASILVMAPMDRAEGRSGKTMPVILKLREAQHKVALAKGLAYWDTFTAMGGVGSMGKWVKAEPQLGSSDFTHPSPKGGEVIGELLLKALTSGYEAYASRHSEAPALP